MATQLAPAPIGHNQPPEPSPYEALKIHIDDLFETAQGFLDGEPIANEEQANAVSKILDDARKARAAAEAQRKIDAKPWDDGKAAVQALWTPLTDEKKGRCAIIAKTCKKALAPWLKKVDDEQRAIAEAARKEADRIAEEARAARMAAEQTDLAARESAEAITKQAEEAAKLAHRAENTRAQAKGGARAVSLRSVWHATVNDYGKLLAHYKMSHPERIKAWLDAEAERDVHAGVRSLAGVTITEERVAQ
jgi:hypothetical protein